MIILKVLDDISNSNNKTFQTALTRHDAKGLYSKMSNFEFTLMTVIWNSSLQRMNSVNKSIKSENSKMFAIVQFLN